MTSVDAKSAATRRAEAELLAITNAVPALVSFYDAGHICRFANDYHAEWYGRPPSDIVGQHMRDIIGPENYALRVPYLEVGATGKPVSFDARVPNKDGTLRECAMRYVPRMGPQGFEGLHILVFDVSRRRNELAEMLDLAHDAIFVRTLTGRVTFWNQGCARLYGIAAPEALDRDAADLLSTRLPQPETNILAQLLESGFWEGELIRQFGDGEERIIDARWSLRRNENGDPAEILETGRDITARRRAQKDLSLSEYRYRNVFRAMAVSFWEMDFSGVTQLLRQLKKEGVTDFPGYIRQNDEFVRRALEITQVIDVNDKTLQMFGPATVEQLRGPVDRFWPRAGQHVFAEAIIASIERRPYLEAETRLRRLDGSEFDTLFTVCFPNEPGRLGDVLVAVVDISDRLRAQDELRKAEANLAHAARISTLGELMASIAHEVNQPLAAIVTNGEAGLRWLKRAEPDLGEVDTALKRMISDGQRASGIIARTRALATRAAPERAPLSINSLVRESAQLIQRELASHDVLLRLELSSGLPDVTADRVQIQQVVINLLVNAVQAMATPDIKHRTISIQSFQDGAFVSLRIVDTGPGIPAEIASRLFDPFFTTKKEGMGMGLSICRSIIESHGGGLSHSSDPGEGTAFRVTLPVSAA